MNNNMNIDFEFKYEDCYCYDCDRYFSTNKRLKNHLKSKVHEKEVKRGRGQDNIKVLMKYDVKDIERHIETEEIKMLNTMFHIRQLKEYVKELKIYKKQVKKIVLDNKNMCLDLCKIICEYL